MASLIAVCGVCLLFAYAHAESSSFTTIDAAKDNHHVIAQKICDACTRYSWFYVSKHNLTATMNRKLFAESTAFFDLPLPQKLALSKNETHYGYIGNASERHDAPHQPVPDLKEAFHVQHYRASTNGNASNLATQNQWPSAGVLPEFESTYTAHIEALVALCMKLSEYFARSLNLSADYFNSDATCFDPEGYNAGIRVLKYQQTVSNASANVLGCGAHSDHGMFTVLYSNGVPGLQVYDTARGLWYDVPFVEGALVVLIGDALQRWSNDRYSSTRHRVAISEIEQPRFSFAFFWAPRLECLMRCLPSICNEQTNERDLYLPMTFGQYVDEMHRQIYAELESFSSRKEEL